MPDIVYAVDADTCLAAVIYKKIFNKKLIFDSHELFSEVPELEGRFFIKKIWKYFEKLIIKNSDLRITVSESVARYFEEFYNLKFYVIRNLPEKKERMDYVNDEKYILYQGALNKGRCLEQLIKATATTGVKVNIAGEGDLSNKLRNIVKRLKLTDKVIFLGKIKPEDLHEITCKAWLGFNILENCSLSYYYSLSNKTFDYIQAQIPQIMPDFVEYRLINNIYNFGVVLNSEEEKIAEIINKLNSDINLYGELKQGAVSASEELIWENEEEKFLIIIKNLFENN